MKYKTIRNKAAGILLAVILAAEGSLPVLAAQADTDAAPADAIYIRTADDLIDLAANGSADTYSLGKTFILENDIDLSGQTFTSIPIFAGTFEGNGHCITGLSIRASGSDLGFFRFVEKDAVIRNLTVSGEIFPEGDMERIGGIAGTNRGRIENCIFKGSILAKRMGGGIAGLNEESGSIIGCENQGDLIVTKQAGGIAGKNDGSISGCKNRGGINMTGQAVSEFIDENPIVLMQEGALAGDVNKVTDIGGIAGRNTGAVLDCINYGAVGYRHTGYNIGGISGYEQGAVKNCRNLGNISGRKNIGGISGLFEPYIQTVYEQDAAEKLRLEGDSLVDMMDGLNDIMDQAAQTNDSNLDDIIDSLERFNNSVRRYKRRYKNRAEDFLDDFGDCLDDVERAIDHLKPEPNAEIDALLASIREKLQKLKEILSALQSSAGDGEDVGGEDVGGGDVGGEDVGGGDVSQLTTESTIVTVNVLAAVTEAPATGESATGESDTGESDTGGSVTGESVTGESDTGESVTGESATGGSASSALPSSHTTSRKSLADYAEELADAQTDTEDLSAELEQLAGLMGEIASDLHQLLALLENSAAELPQDIANTASAVRRLVGHIENASEDLYDDFDDMDRDLSSQLNRLFDQIRSAKDDLDLSKDDLTDQLDLISGQLHQISNTMADGLDHLRDRLDFDPTDSSEWYTDLSDDERTDYDAGLIDRCSNEGDVLSDTNGGGITGLTGIAVSLDSDPSIEETGEKSFQYERYVRATILDCQNSGSVLVKNSCAGGITGRADLGSVIRCENYGAVKVEDGGYAGGITGRSAYLVRNCYVLCDVSGEDHVGGISGLGMDTLENTAMTGIISQTQEMAGNILGEADEDARISGNRFVSNGIAAVSGLTYADQAQMITYQELMESEGTPDAFESFTVRFLADGKTVKTIQMAYGEKVQESDIPPVPALDGKNGVWEEKDLSFINRNIVVNAVYSDWVTTLACEGDPAPFMVSGYFSKDAVLQYESIPLESAPDLSGYRPVEAYTFQIAGSASPDGATYRVRILADGVKGDHILTWSEDGQQLIPAEREGRYLIFSAPTGHFAVMVSTALPIPALAAAVVAVAAAIAGCIYLFRRKKRAKK